MSGLQPNLYAAIGVTWAVATLSMIGRVIARRMTKVIWWHEDYFCLAAYLFSSCYNTLCLYWAMHWGLGKLLPDTLSEDQRYEILKNGLKISFFNSICYTWSIAMAKLAVLSLYWRLFGRSSIRIPIIILSIASIVWVTIRTFLVIFRCSPVPAYWDSRIPGGECHIKDSVFFFGTILPHLLMDVVILILPVIEVMKLRLRSAQKVAIVALFFMGVVVCVASVFVLHESLTFDPKSQQLPYDYTLNNSWAAVEINIAVVSSCFPLLRPIFRLIFGSRVLSSYEYGHGASYGNTTYGNRSHAARSFVRHGGMELGKMSKSKRRTKNDPTTSMADEEAGILGDPSVVTSPDPIHATVIAPNHLGKQHDAFEYGKGIHVRSDVVVQVHQVDGPKSLNSEPSSTHSAGDR